MRVIKAYSIPIKDAPVDLIDAYMEIRRKALDYMLSKVEFKESKAKFTLLKEDRKRLRDSLLEDWKFSKHYVDSAINTIIGLVKGWVRLHNRGKAKRKPRITRRTVYVKRTLITYRDGVLKISVEPRRRYLVINLKEHPWIPEEFDDVGGCLLTDERLIVVVRRETRPVNPEGWASFDVNLTNITALIGGELRRYDLRALYHIHRVYEEKRRRIQRMMKHKPKTAKRLLEKYSRRERNRARDFLQKLTTKIARELQEKKLGAILENLKGIKERTLNKGRRLNRRLSKWNARQFQFMLSYKLTWVGLPVKLVNPAYSSRTCPRCSGRLAASEGRLMRCRECGFEADRDVVAVLNLHMWGVWVSPEGLRDPHTRADVEEGVDVHKSPSTPKPIQRL